jgi:hypothetical protein
MTSMPLPRPEAAPPRPRQRLLVAVVVGVVAEVALLAALAHAAWSPSTSENMPRLSREAGLTAIVVCGLPASLLILGTCLWTVLGKRGWATVGTGFLVAMAGAAGFVGYALTSFSRVEMSDC